MISKSTYDNRELIKQNRAYIIKNQAHIIKSIDFLGLVVDELNGVAPILEHHRARSAFVDGQLVSVK